MTIYIILFHSNIYDTIATMVEHYNNYNKLNLLEHITRMGKGADNFKFVILWTYYSYCRTVLLLSIIIII